MHCCSYFYNNNINNYFNEKNSLRKISQQIEQSPDILVGDNNINLVLDSKNSNEMPKHFRKSTDLLNTQSNENLNISGLDRLNISGSQQFSGYNLTLLKYSIGIQSHITVVDLRQESHGFINGYPISYANAKNDANIGLTFYQVMLNEYSKLNNIKLNVPISFYNHKNITIVPIKVENECHLAFSKSLSYIRIPVTDGKIPTDDMVDYFIKLVKLQPKNSWLHFHCKQGIGRTTTFMIMYDMIKNSSNVEATDIVKRQFILANFDETQIKSFNNNERINLLENFYKYCKDKILASISWREWKKLNSIN